MASSASPGHAGVTLRPGRRWQQALQHNPQRCRPSRPLVRPTRTEQGILVGLWELAVHAMAMLAVRRLTKRFGGLIAVNAVTFDVEEGEILSIIGPNGAGKSTLFKLITAFLKPTNGRIAFCGEDITRLPPHLVARRGIVRTFQEPVIFKEMTARQNVVIAHHLQSRASSWGIFFHSAHARADEAAFRKQAEDILEYLGLGELKHEQARNLPHG